MKNKQTKIALIYDFDGTLSRGNMQEATFIPDVCRMSAKDFWNEVVDDAAKHNADERLCYMYKMLDKAKGANVSLKREAFEKHGKNVPLFEGVLEWFDGINQYAVEQGIDIKHFVISSGNKELINGTPIAKYFEQIFACEFYYDIDGIATKPAVAIDYTNKTQYLFRINKKVLTGGKNEHGKTVNDFVPDEDRDIPFTNMIYIGDGDTDIPCMKLVKDKGGFSIGVYDDEVKKEAVKRLQNDGRINYMAEANYASRSDLMCVVKKALNSMHAKTVLHNHTKSIQTIEPNT